MEAGAFDKIDPIEEHNEVYLKQRKKKSFSLPKTPKLSVSPLTRKLWPQCSNAESNEALVHCAQRVLLQSRAAPAQPEFARQCFFTRAPLPSNNQRDSSILQLAGPECKGVETAAPGEELQRGERKWYVQSLQVDVGYKSWWSQNQPSLESHTPAFQHSWSCLSLSYFINK